MVLELIRRPGMDLSLLGITQADIDNRGLVAVGYAKRELKPPYDNSSMEKRAGEILEYLGRKKRAIKRGSTGYIPEDKLSGLLPHTKVIEVVGGLAPICVPEAIESILRSGRLAYVESRRLLDMDPASDFELGEMVRRNSERRGLFQSQRLVIGTEQFLYHRAGIYEASR